MYVIKWSASSTRASATREIPHLSIAPLAEAVPRYTAYLEAPSFS